MAGKINVYDIAGAGVNLTKAPFHNADNEVIESQNAELVLDSEEGGEGVISKRGGYVYLNTDALGASIIGMAEVRFIESAEAQFQESDLVSEASRFTSGAASITLSGAATSWEAMNADDAAYCMLELINTGSIAQVTVTADAMTDPGVNTDFVLHFLLLVTGTPAGASTGFVMTLQNNVGATVVQHTLNLAALQANATGAVYVEYTTTLTSGQVDTFRSGGGFTAHRFYLNGTGFTSTPGIDLLFDRVWLTCPTP